MPVITSHGQAVCCALGAASCLLGAAPARSAAPLQERFELARKAPAASQTLTLRVRYEVTNPSARVVAGGKLLAMLPVDETATQRLLGVESSRPAELVELGRVQRALRVDLGALPPYGTVPVSIVARVAVSAAPRPLAPRGQEASLAAERLIEVDDARVQAAGADLRRATAEATARSVFDRVRERVHDSGFAARARGAAQSLASGAGDCTDMALVFAALCRVAGVPARVLGGYVTERSAVLSPQDFHNWAEYHDGKTWRLADPQRGVLAEHPERYVATHVALPSEEGPMAGSWRFRVLPAELKGRMLRGR